MTYDCLPTCDEDERLRRSLINHLNRHGHAHANVLARTLATCDDRRPCRSAACPHCGREFQLALFELYRDQIKAPAKVHRRGRTSALTIVPATGFVAPNRLDANVSRRVSEDVADALAACCIPPTIATLDVSYNEHAENLTPDHWCVHVQGVTADWLDDGHLKALRARFPRSHLCGRPVHSEWLDDDPAGALYHLKPDRCRRVSYTVPAVEGGRKAYRDSKRRPLRPDQRVAVALAEHEVGFQGRLISHGIDADAIDALFDAFYRVRDGP